MVHIHSVKLHETTNESLILPCVAPSEDKYLGYLSTYNLKIHHAVKLALEKDPHTPFYWKLNELTERVKDYVSLFYGEDAKK